MGLPRSPKCALRGGLTRDEVKVAVRERDGGKCTACGTTDAEHVEATGRRTEVHRKVPGSVYTVEGCVLLCRACHGPQPKRARGTSDADGSDRKLVRLPIAYREPLKELCRKSRRPMTTEVCIAIEKHCLEYGVVVPPRPRPRGK